MKYPSTILTVGCAAGTQKPKLQFPHRRSRLLKRLDFTSIGTLVLALVAIPGYGQSVQERTPGSGLLSRNAIALNPATGKVYAVESSKGAVAVIDGKTGSVSSVKVGAGPIALTINSVTNRIYVANHDGGTVSVLDGKTDRVLATLNVGSLPYSLAANSATNKIYVSNVYSSVDSIIDGATNTIATIKAGSADAIVVDTARNDTYLLGYESGVLTMLHGDSISSLFMGKMHIWGMALDSAAGALYVTRIGNGDLVDLDVRSHKMTTIAAGSMPCAVAVNSKTKMIYVVNYADETVSVIDARTHQPVSTVPVGHHPQAIAVDDTTDLIYVANTLDNDLTVIDGASNKVAATLKAGTNPYAIAVDASAGAVYVADQGDPSFTKVDIRQSRKTGP